MDTSKNMMGFIKLLGEANQNIKEISNAFLAIGETISNIFPVFSQFEILDEKAYRAYTAFINLRRPRGHKISWKRLNRQQRYDAMKWFDRMIDIGGVYRSYWERVY